MATADMIKEIPDISGHSIELDALIKELNTDVNKGLTSESAKKKLEIYGPNVIPKPKQSFWKVYLAPLLNTLIVVYLIMTGLITLLAFIYLFINPSDFQIWITAGQWLIIVGINFAIAIVQQARAQKKIEALQKLSAPSARVIRDGKEMEISTDEVVPGDIIKIAQGDKIPADARIIKSVSLRVNESSLTGESVAAHKVEDGTLVLPEDTPIGERKNMLYNGTFATFGSGVAVVVNTGGHTEFGKISLELEALNTGDIPIRSKVNTIGNYLTAGMALIFSLLLIYQGGVLLNRIASGDLFGAPTDKLFGELIFNLSTMIITAMSVVPINIPLLTTIILVTGVLAMAKHNVIIRNLASIESLGRISILCSDKTGTITAGQMTVKRIYDATTNKHYYVTGLGYSPEGKIVELKEEELGNISERDLQTYPDVEIELDSSLGMLIISGMLNNDSQITKETVEATGQIVFNATGSPTEASLMALFDKTGLDKNEIREKFKIIREFPFDSSLKRMSKVVESEELGKLVFCKGATEIVLPRCTHIGYGKSKRKITEKDIKVINDHIKDFASLGYRLLSLTYKKIDKLPKKGEKERDEIESNLSYLGFVAVLDPPREKVDESVTETIGAGITPIMITGDSPLTAASIANNIGMVYLKDRHLVHEGKMASRLNDEDFLNTRVFARVSPDDKRVIVERYKRQNRVVAMTGDGVNDALALSMADAGIAMGISGTEVSKQAADLVIADDSFNSIVTGIREGRALFQRIRVIIFFYICLNLAEAATYIGTSFLSGLPGFEGFVLMDNLQRAYIFGIAHSFPPIALIIDRIPKDIMDRTPIDTAGIFNKKLALTLLATVIALASVIYIVYFSTYFNYITVNSVNSAFYTPIMHNEAPTPNLRPLSLNHAKARTMMHTILYLAIPFIVLSIRRIDKSLLASIKEDSYWLTYLCAFSIIPIHLGLMYIPSIQENILEKIGVYVDIIGLSLGDWFVCLIAALIPLLVLETAKWINRLRGEYY
ncbi:MAG: cation-translocating P-type ATPase [Candidatus Hodarchaeales archaeon]